MGIVLYEEHLYNVIDEGWFQCLNQVWKLLQDEVIWRDARFYFEHGVGKGNSKQRGGNIHEEVY